MSDSIHLPIGSVIETDEPGFLNGAKFNRHTFWCGQSGSGKTYALGVVLEQVLLRTGLPIVVFDPNSDFVRIKEQRDGIDPADAQALDELDVRVLRPRSEGADNLVVRLIDMPLQSRAAVLRLDPINDSEEYHVLRQMDHVYGSMKPEELIARLRQSNDPVWKKLYRRIDNLGVLDWDLWAMGAKGAEQTVDERPDATVLDIGSFRHPDEAPAAALAVLDRLWATRERRDPILIVIDEAHNLCPADPATPVQKAVVSRLIQIAAEGRKFGLWLLLSTQRPSKVHPQVLSQCDNLCLMKTNSPADLDQLSSFFGAIPRKMLDRAQEFTLGQGLFAGGFSPEPTLVQMADRLTPEGGSDVKVPATRG